jgi:hypothetical protein
MTKQLYNVWVCVDCSHLANGTQDESEPYQLADGDSDRDLAFSGYPCELCDSHLAGARMHCVAWERE